MGQRISRLFESHSDYVKRIDNERWEFADVLKKNGHTCVRTYESLPIIVGWCEKEKCVLSQ